MEYYKEWDKLVAICSASNNQKQDQVAQMILEIDTKTASNVLLNAAVSAFEISEENIKAYKDAALILTNIPHDIDIGLVGNVRQSLVIKLLKDLYPDIEIETDTNTNTNTDTNTNTNTNTNTDTNTNTNTFKV